MVGYVFEFPNHGQFDPNGKLKTPVPDVTVHNKAVEIEELAWWKRAPKIAYVYIIGHNATTWMGAPLGTVTITSTYKLYTKYGEPYTMTSIRVRANNGATYFGRYGSDNSGCCCVRKNKIQGESK